MDKRNAVLAEARKHIGVKESPAGSNKIFFNDWFYAVKGYAAKWCATSVSYIFHHAGYPIGKVDYLRGIAGCVYALKCLNDPSLKRKWGTIIHPHEVQPGDVAMVDWQGDGMPDHFVLIEKPYNITTTGEFYTLEGNTSDKGSQSNGGEFMPKLRDKDKGKWTFVRPAVYDIV